MVDIDRTFFTNLYGNLQFFVDFIEDGKEAVSHKRKSYGLTFEINDKFLDDLTAGFRGMYFTSPVCACLSRNGRQVRRTGRNEDSALEILQNIRWMTIGKSPQGICFSTAPNITVYANLRIMIWSI